MKFYSLKKIMEKKAIYNIIIGERSNGKTYSVLEYGIRKYIENGEQMAIIRRWQDDFRGKRGSVMFDGHVTNGCIQKLSDGKWNSVHYWGGRWFLCNISEEGKVIDDTPFAYGFSLSSMEHDKSTSYPNITTIVFDEFLTRGSYIPDEFVLFANVISTIVRHRTNVIIFMLGNTVNKYCPYFAEMGLNHIKDMKQGDIDVYRYGESGLSVAVEYCSSRKQGKPSDIYFAFDNPKLTMITGGAWEIEIYPHCPIKYCPKDIIKSFFIMFNSEMLQGDIILKNKSLFIFIHRKTTDIKDTNNDLIYCPDIDYRKNWCRNLTRPANKLQMKIFELFKLEKVFYQDNEVGEIVRNYLLWCGYKI